MTFLNTVRSKESYFESIEIQSKSSKIHKIRTYEQFDKFSKSKFKVSLEEMIDELLKQKPIDMNQNTCDVFQQWINSLVKSGKAPATIITVVSHMKQYFNYRGIKLTTSDMNSVNMPKKLKEEKYPLTKEEIRTILDNSSYQRKTLYLTLAGSLMRIGETCSLRKKDFDTTKKRIVIHLKAEITKLKKERITFVSKEAEPYVRKRLREIEDNDLVFGTNENQYNAVLNEEMYWSRLMNRIFPNLDKYSTGRRKITMHSFRAFGITKTVRTVSDSFAFLLAGQEGYLPMYKRYTEEEKLEDYLKVEPEFFIYLNPEFKTKDEKDKRIDELESRLNSIQIMLEELTQRRKK